MRSTVGPLPAAVYWRRRLAVLAALLVLVFGVVFACSGSDPEGGQRGAGSTSRIPTSGTPSADMPVPETVEPSFEETGPQVDPGGDNVPVGPAPDETALPSPDIPQQTETCTDAEIRVTPVPGRTAAKRGDHVDLRLRIRNVSTRTCTRDVGADLQEIYISQGSDKVWSSDVCGLAKGSDVQRLTPNSEREYRVTWNGRTTTKCTGGVAAGPAPAAGKYEILGRLGAKLSEPVRLSLAA